MAAPVLEEDGVLGRTSRHPAKVRQRGAPGRIVQAQPRRAGPAHAARQNDAERGHPGTGGRSRAATRSLSIAASTTPRTDGGALRGPRIPPRIPLRPGGRVVARNASSHTQESRTPTVALGQRGPNVGGAGAMAEVA